MKKNICIENRGGYFKFRLIKNENDLGAATKMCRTFV